MQLLTNLWRVIRAFFEAIGKLLFFLLFTLYLWIPALYLAGLWIASVSVGFEFARYSTYIVVGVSMCLALSALLLLRRYILKPSGKRVKASEVRNTYISDGTVVTEQPLQERPSAPPRKEAVVQAAQPDVSPDVTNGQPPMGERLYAPQQQATQPQKAPVDHEEPPVFFRTRRDPTLFIAEYSDRLEFYRKSEGGYHLVSTEPKDN